MIAVNLFFLELFGWCCFMSYLCKKKNEITVAGLFGLIR